MPERILQPPVLSLDPENEVLNFTSTGVETHVPYRTVTVWFASLSRTGKFGDRLLPVRTASLLPPMASSPVKCFGCSMRGLNDAENAICRFGVTD